MIRMVAIGAAAAAVVTPAAAAAANERRVAGWPRMSVAFAGQDLIYAASTDARIRPGGYVIHRTDTFALPLRGARLTGARRPGVVLRTSAGVTTAGPLAGGPGGRHVIVATGRGFTPQVIFCCRPGGLDFPVQATGRPGAPVALAAALAWPLARTVTVAGDGGVELVTRHVRQARDEPFGSRVVTPVDAAIAGGLVAMSPGTLAWVDARTSDIRVAAIPLGGATASPARTVAPGGQVTRLHATDETILALIRRSAGFVLVRFDQPGLEPEVIWRGARAPGPTAAGRDVAVMIDGTRVQAHAPGGPLATVMSLRGPGAAVATDGRRVAAIERIQARGRRGPVRQSAIRVAPAGVVAP